MPSEMKRALQASPNGGKIALERQYYGSTLQRRRNLKNTNINDLPMTNFDGVIYMANITIQNASVLVQVDTGSSDLWVSCYYVGGVDCKTTCPTKSAMIHYGSGSVCVQPVLEPIRFGEVTVSKYVVGIAQGRNVFPMDASSLLLGNAQGLLGLAYGSIATIPTPGGQLIDYMKSFSIFLTQDNNAAGSFLMVNGVDEELIARKKMTAHRIPLKIRAHWTIGMTQFGVGEETPVFPCTTGSDNSCDALIDTGTSLIVMPNSVFEKFATTYLNPQGCQYGSTTGEEVDSVYVCPTSAKLPRLAFTFGDTTFYLNSKDYILEVTPTEMIVELQPAGKGQMSDVWVLGDTFLKVYYSSYVVNDSVVLYCPGGECSGNSTVAPTNSPGSNTGSSTAGPTIIGPTGNGGSSPLGGGGNNGAGGSANNSTPTKSNTRAVTALTIVVGVLGSILVVGLVIVMMRWRRRRQARREAEEVSAYGHLQTPNSVQTAQFTRA
ncbi:TPA: hypothetical protein N0F65_005806 [Lagenidium giganteum]|uniref:Peptidase A1 domain-containing protein n=1 Tax=Lagenidium giganteum TaxID=4803 RepID=A0AAV2YTR7_9STRA|nr:TPA: hypothetical protein N0F65_005806 [Lagenidium giganteum]